MNVRKLGNATIALSSLLGGCAVAPTATYGISDSASTPYAPSTSYAPAPPANAHLKEGTWHIGGSSSAMYDNRQIDDVETKTFGLHANAGKFIKPNILVEGDLGYTNSDTDFGPSDVEQSEFMLGAAVRYYFDNIQGNTVPYVRGMAGLLYENIDAGGGVDDDDTSPYLGVAGGAETFITDWLSLDYGLRFIYAFDVFDDDLTDFGLYIGLSLWK